MTVELINNNSGDVLDLTGGSDSQSSEEGTDEILDLTGSDDSVSDDDESQSENVDDDTSDTSDKDSEEDSDLEDKSDDSDSSDEDKEESDEDAPELFFGDQQVSVEVPDEIKTALDEAGIDSKELLSQLFKKDGDFSLDDEMRTKLEDKFGKTLVDGYLNMYKNINEQTNKSHQVSKEEEEKAASVRSEEYSTTVGGEEGLVAMESFILDKFKPEQIEAYNAVMESEDHASQIFILSQIKEQMALTDKLENGDKDVTLIGDSDASSSTTVTTLDKGWLSNDEYNTIMESDKYWEDSEYSNRVDAARKVGIRSGK